MPYEPGQVIKTLGTGNSFNVQSCHKGGMGVVYIAERQKDKKLYALKTIRDDKIKDEIKRENFIKRFRWESQVWIVLGKHRNIVQAYWFDFTYNYEPLLVMEYVEGHPNYGNTLKDWLLNKSLDLKTILNFSIQALTGLIYAQKVIKEELNMPFVHRDLKPANLLITKDGTVKVTDFGLVKAFGILESGICGTPLYMPPEQWNGKEIEEKTDIYALGCVIYEMIERRPPWGLTKNEIRKRHFSKRPKPLEKVPIALNHIIIKCLEKDPHQRQSFSELREELQRLHKRLTGKRVNVKDYPEPLSSEELNQRGSGFDQLGLHKKAISCYNKAIAINPEDARFFLNRGNSYFCLFQYDKAIKNYHEAINLSPKLPEPYIALGNVYSKKGQYEEAIQNYNRAEEFNPEVAEIYLARGNACANLKQYERAIKDYKKAMDLNPDFAEAYMGLANVYVCLKDYKQAEKYYDTAIKKNPQYAQAYIALAKLYHLMGQDEKIDKYLKRATDIDPNIGEEYGHDSIS